MIVKYIKITDIIGVAIALIIAYLLYTTALINDNQLPKELFIATILICSFGFIIFQITGRYLEDNFINLKQFKFFFQNGFKIAKSDNHKFIFGIYKNYPIKIKFSRDTKIYGFRSGWAYLVTIFLGKNIISQDKIITLNNKYRQNWWKRFNSRDYSEIIWESSIVKLNIKQYLVDPVIVKDYIDSMVQILRAEKISCKVNIDYLIKHIENYK